jgi:hypothetical protein
MGQSAALTDLAAEAVTTNSPINHSTIIVIEKVWRRHEIIAVSPARS